MTSIAPASKIDEMIQSRTDDIRDTALKLSAPDFDNPEKYMALISRFNMLSKSIENLTGTKFEAYVKQNPDKFKI